MIHGGCIIGGGVATAGLVGLSFYSSYSSSSAGAFSLPVCSSDGGAAGTRGGDDRGLAEVEATRQQYDLLINEGCEQGQGRFSARPVPQSNRLCC